MLNLSQWRHIINAKWQACGWLYAARALMSLAGMLWRGNGSGWRRASIITHRGGQRLRGGRYVARCRRGIMARNAAAVILITGNLAYHVEKYQYPSSALIGFAGGGGVGCSALRGRREWHCRHLCCNDRSDPACGYRVSRRGRLTGAWRRAVVGAWHRKPPSRNGPKAASSLCARESLTSKPSFSSLSRCPHLCNRSIAPIMCGIRALK